jgi:hypothetical protein
MNAMRTGSFALAAAGVVALAAGCSGSKPGGTGIVTGSTPTCYGPGPNDNLTPRLKVDVRQGSRLVTSGEFRSSNRSHQYRFSLAAGSYEISTSPGGKPIRVVILAGQTKQADLPSVSCL